MRTKCPVVRQQRPPYQDQTTSYHEWKDGRCIHCQQIVAQIQRPITPHHWERYGRVQRKSPGAQLPAEDII